MLRAVGRMVQWLPLLAVVWLARLPMDEVAGARQVGTFPIDPLLVWALIIGALVVGRGSLRSLLALLGYPLLRSLAVGSWPLWATLSAVLIGGVIALWQTARALVANEPRDAQRLALLGAALACVGLGSPLGVVAALTALLVYAAIGNTVSLRSPFPFGATFVAWWFVVAAAVAAQVWLLVAVFVWAVLCCGVASLRAGRSQSASSPFLLRVLGGVMWFGTPLFIGPFAQRFLLPVTTQLAVGLNQFGTVETWPWLGVGARNAAQGRVLLLPVMVWFALGLVIGALLVLVRGWPWHMLADSAEEGLFLHGRVGAHRRAPLLRPPQPHGKFLVWDDAHLWQVIQQRVWWLGRG